MYRVLSVADFFFALYFRPIITGCKVSEYYLINGGFGAKNGIK